VRLRYWHRCRYYHRLNVARVDILLAASGYVKVDRRSVLYTADGVVFHHTRFFIIIESKRAKRPLTLQYAYTNYTQKCTYKIKLTSHKTVLATAKHS